MPSDKSIWFRLGYAYERARLGSSAGRDALAPLSERRAAEQARAVDRAPDAQDHGPTWPSSEEMIAAGAMFVLDRIVGGRARAPGVLGLLRAGLAGAGAALFMDLVHPLLTGRPELPALDRDSTERLVGGFGQGLVYGAVVAPHVPGPAVVKGAVYGSVEYVTDPMGGLSALVGKHTPQGRFPVLGDLFSGLALRERVYLEHLVFGIALALLYESNRSSNGILEEGEEA